MMISKKKTKKLKLLYHDQYSATTIGILTIASKYTKIWGRHISDWKMSVLGSMRDV